MSTGIMIDDADPAAVYSGNWTAVDEKNDFGIDSSWYKGTIHYSTTPNDEVTVTFQGKPLYYSKRKKKYPSPKVSVLWLKPPGDHPTASMEVFPLCTAMTRERNLRPWQPTDPLHCLTDNTP
jgi:hypothetical protein